MKKSKENPEDMGTPEISKRYRVIPVLTRGQFGMNAKVVDETEIDRLLLEDHINPSQHAALENFLNRLVRGGFVGLKSPSYDAPISADPAMVAARKSEAIRAASHMIGHLRRVVGRNKTDSLMNLVLMDKKWELPIAELHSCVNLMERYFTSSRL